MTHTKENILSLSQSKPKNGTNLHSILTMANLECAGLKANISTHIRKMQEENNWTTNLAYHHQRN
jgi:hypothetical protein